MILIDNASLITIDCEFKNIDWQSVGEFYTCYPKVLKIEKVNDRRITKAIGDYHYNRTRDDVKGLVIYDQTIRFFPQNILTFFPNIIAVWVHNSSLHQLDQNDLRPYGKNLELLAISKNELESLNENLFVHNANLKYIDLRDNRIKYVYDNVFDSLKDLKYINMRNNVCYNEEEFSSDDRDHTLEIIGKIKDKCSKIDGNIFATNDSDDVKTNTITDDVEGEVNSAQKNEF